MEETDKLIPENDNDKEDKEEKDYSQEDNKLFSKQNNEGMDQIFLDPLEKFAIYKKFPYVLLVHLLLIE